jgi:hypothetical protein
VCQWVGLKTTGMVFSGLDSKPVMTVSLVGLKTGGDSFSSLASKPVATVSWLSLKTKVVDGFPIWASKPAGTVW